MGFSQTRKDPREGGIGVVGLFEFEKGIDERAPFAFCDADGKEEQYGEVCCLFHHDALLIEVRRQQCGRDAPFLQMAVLRYARRGDGHLDGVQHTVVVFNVSETVPCRVGP